MDEKQQAKKWAGPARVLSAAELADHHAVCQLVKIYAIGFDMRDYDLARTAFADGSTWEGKTGDEPIDEALPKIYGMAASFTATQHFIGNQYVDLQGDTAVVWSYGIAHHKLAPGGDRDEVIAGVQYRDECKRFSEGDVA
jgi:SnoaL-like domain